MQYDSNLKFKAIIGQRILQKTDFYTEPIRSSFLDIYASDGILSDLAEFQLEDVESKLFCIQSLECQKIFIPILHTQT